MKLIELRERPSLIYALAWQAADMRMRKDGRTKWNSADSDLYCETFEKWCRHAFERDDDPYPDKFRLRFQEALWVERHKDATRSKAEAAKS